MSSALNVKPLPDVSFVKVLYVAQTNQGTLALTEPSPWVKRVDGSASKAGDVLSWNPPDGHWELRAPGTAGAYERETVNGNTVTYRANGVLNVFAYIPVLPNG